MAARPLTGVLLVGGASSRFGSPKALATLDGETLAARAWRTLERACDHVVAVGKTVDDLDLPFAVIDDASDVRAPIAGLVAGLRASATELAVALPVDTPLVRSRDLRRLADACADIAVPQIGPLPAALRRTALPVLEDRLAVGELALRDAFSGLETRVVELEPATLANVNTPEELAALQVEIVPFRPEHAEGFRALVGDTLREFGFEPDPALDPDLSDPAEAYEALWIATTNDVVVGSVALRRIGPGALQLKRMYLMPGQRGRGLGRRLLATALDWARRDHADVITLDTTERMEEARRLYEQHGFVRVSGGPPRQGQSRFVYELRL